ncbi:MAG: antibiotic biosynthesis monooxygenase [Candidatus Magnetominusculus sp. LBB02]|nr:antibiotic biosynthesis monooxygenase [Candidatus Magnetominusculus sp. LBB02]
MKEDKIIVLALIKAKEGMTDVVKQELTALIQPTRSESGCISYELHQSKDSVGHFMFYEQWESKEALDKHLATPYLQNIIKKSTELFAEPIQVTLWKKE